MEVGEYVRTQNGRIGRVIKIWVWEETSKRKKQTHYLIDWGGKASYISILKNLKHSKNIIDLIELYDYVNNFLVFDIITYENGDKKIQLSTGVLIGNNKIENVVTHEQFESIKYEVN